jgi:hypothetical protein
MRRTVNAPISPQISQIGDNMTRQMMPSPETRPSR